MLLDNVRISSYVLCVFLSYLLTPFPIEHFPRIFDRPNGEQFDYVFNCGGVTESSRPEDIYEYRIYGLSMAMGRESARRGVRAFVECSTGHVYKANSTPRKETDSLQPWNVVAKWKLKAEQGLQEVKGLNLVILRFPAMYGPYDTGFFATGITMARVSKSLDRHLTLLYTRNLKINTIYIKDAVSALWTAAEWRSKQKSPPPETKSSIFNIVDHNDTKQEHMAQALSESFDLKVDFLGSLGSQLAKMSLDDIVDEANEDMLQVWAELLEDKQIQRPGPINPFVERDVLKSDDLSLDGSLFESITGWKPKREAFNADTVNEIVRSYENMGWWP